MNWFLGLAPAFFFAALIQMALPAAAAENMTLAVALRAPLVDGGAGFIDEVTKEAYKRLDIDVEIVKLPPPRLLRAVNVGKGDGCLFRPKGTDNNYTNLIRVPEAMLLAEYMAFTTNPDIEIKSWDDLKPHAVGYVKGWKVFKEKVADLENVTVASSSNRLFEMLKDGRVDVILYERWQGQYLVKALGVDGARALNPPLEKVEMFSYLYKKHSDLVPKVAASLAAMKADGTYQEMHDRILSPYAGE